MELRPTAEHMSQLDRTLSAQSYGNLHIGAGFFNKIDPSSAGRQRPAREAPSFKENEMKAIIHGLRYDTDKAIFIGEASHGYCGDFSHWDAGLYRTPRSGRYFLAGSGGPMTRFARQGQQQNETRGGSGIQPMDPDQALEWAEQHLTHKEIEGAFAANLEDA